MNGKNKYGVTNGMSVSETGGNTVYEYDGDGTRISKTQAGVKTKYINDMALPLVQVLLETNDANVIQAVYTYGNDLISMKRAGVNSYYNYDGLGSTRQLTDSSGDVTVSYTYDSFGNKIASTGTSANTYGFTGEQQFNEADELVFLRERYYDPRIGRFLQMDPLGYELNVYVYCLNNPIIYVDPKGLACYKIKINLKGVSVESAKTTGLCPPFTEIAAKIFGANYIKSKFPIIKKDDTCPPCYHCDWWNPIEGNIKVEKKNYLIKIPEGIKCVLHVTATIKTQVMFQFGSCKKDKGECCP